MSDAFDFIIVGGGTAGCLVAQRLASAAPRVSILLIEIGDDNSDILTRIPFERYSNVFMRPELDHGYSTVPQSTLKNRKVPYPRGKGLGGSTAINFMIWAPGSSMDYDRWAELVGDDDWGWEKTNARLKQIQSFHGTVSPTLQKYANPIAEDHGFSGSVAISIPDEWEPDAKIVMDAADKFGFPINLDPTTGNPIGIGISPNSAHAGLRTTSASAHLSSPLTNLTVWTKTRVIRVVLDGKKAVAVDLADGRIVTANREVILCAGAIDTPKLLLLSGIGPKDELAKHNVELCHDLPGVGKNLQDHPAVFLTEHLGDGFSSKVNFMSTPSAVDSARQEWLEFKTGPLTTHFASAVLGFLKDDSIYETEAFNALDPEMQQFLRHRLVPQYEFGWGGPLLPPTYEFKDIDDAFLSTVIVLMNPVSRGTVTIGSSNPEDPPLIDFSFLSHPLDKLTLIAAIRKAIHFTQSPSIDKYWKSHINVPKSDSDEDIWDFIADNCGPLWHANGSVVMSKSGEELGCVDSSLKVFGIEGLRVADMSVCPLTSNGHTQATAYLIGQVAAEKICLEHQLDISD
ncbi:GMC oxidoreductase [Oidiodendron maius Zn]|uniref:GMC oxidoreductase n=1 Tax=Oidiodendron maius (strain Zn) TaxID=913774 RepID=A0A0C3HQE6_OIDMZ|nr:GMC oxidoreductase [Oidiodendron maius Zn]